MYLDDFEFSKNCLTLFIDQFGKELGITHFEFLSEMEDQKLCEDCLFHLKSGLSNHASFRFRTPSYYHFQDITLRYIRPSGRKCDLSKINAKWFLYGVLSQDKKNFSRVILLKWTNAFENYLLKHREILSEPIWNDDGSSAFKTVKIRDIPQEFIEFCYDYKKPKLTTFAFLSHKNFKEVNK